MKDFWTEVKTMAMVELVDVGMSYEAVAAELGSTRGAVAGKVARLKASWPTTDRAPINLPPVGWTPQ